MLAERSPLEDIYKLTMIDGNVVGKFLHVRGVGGVLVLLLVDGFLMTGIFLRLFFFFFCFFPQTTLQRPLGPHSTYVKLLPARSGILSVAAVARTLTALAIKY